MRKEIFIITLFFLSLLNGACTVSGKSTQGYRGFQTSTGSSSSGLVVGVQPIYDKAQLEEKFSMDLIATKILPVQVSIENFGNEPAMLKVSDLAMVFSDGSRTLALSTLTNNPEKFIRSTPYFSFGCQALEKVAPQLGLVGILTIMAASDCW
ncbi:MAG: hypothetical protein ACKN9W_08480, partial [Methylococcus sp.]